ncbi:MAG TPA: hypothetical protein VJM53_01535 [Burkholderiales bacterium]|jgi:hypothetical protein|nr:hypothetical protein [Burkholderiales bacterium]
MKTNTEDMSPTLTRYRPVGFDWICFLALLPAVLGIAGVMACMLAIAMPYIFIMFFGITILLVPEYISVWAISAVGLGFLLRLWIRLIHPLRGKMVFDLFCALGFSFVIPRVVRQILEILQNYNPSEPYLQGAIAIISLASYPVVAVTIALRLYVRSSPRLSSISLKWARLGKFAGSAGIALLWVIGTVGSFAFVEEVGPLLKKRRLAAEEVTRINNKHPIAKQICSNDLDGAKAAIEKPDVQLDPNIIGLIIHSCLSQYIAAPVRGPEGTRFYSERIPVIIEAIALAEKRQGIDSTQGCTDLQKQLLRRIYDEDTSLAGLDHFINRRWPIACYAVSYDGQYSFPLWWTTVYQYQGLTEEKAVRLKTRGIDFGVKDSHEKTLLESNTNHFRDSVAPEVLQLLKGD